ncbi:hypothetical protein Hanom_Chr07g00624691 [Helianthus anomalus]
MSNLTLSLHLNLPDSLSSFCLLLICLSPHLKKPEISFNPSHNSPPSSSSTRALTLPLSVEDKQPDSGQSRPNRRRRWVPAAAPSPVKPFQHR